MTRLPSTCAAGFPLPERGPCPECGAGEAGPCGKLGSLGPAVGEIKDGVVTVAENSQYSQWLRDTPNITKNELARLVEERDRLRADVATLAYTATRKAEELEHLRRLLGGVEERLRQETASGWDTPATTLDAIADTIGIALRPGWRPRFK